MKKTILLSTVATILVMFVALFTQVGAEPGKLDPTFGENGVSFVDFGELNDNAHSMFLQPDGKLLVSGWADIWPGDFGTVRLLRDGNPDPSFGQGGIVTTAYSDNPANVDAAWSVTAAPDGRIYVSGEICDEDYIICDFGTVAYHEGGTIDESFASDGKTAVNPGADTVYAWPRRDILQDDGKLIVGGIAYSDGETVDIVLRRHNPDGSLDEMFGTDGFVVQDFDNENNYPQDILTVPGGKILVVGGFGEPTDDPFFYKSGIAYMAQYNSDGTLDTTFGGGDGLVTWDHKGDEAIGKGGLYGSDGMIYVLGEALYGSTGDCTLRRFTSEGVPDPDFGVNSWVTIEMERDDECWDLRETPDHKLAFSGTSYPPAPEEHLQRVGRTASGRRSMTRSALQEESAVMTIIGRYNMDGSPDETFGPDGLSLTQAYPTGSGGFSLVVQPDGKLITHSREYSLAEGTDRDFGIIRFLGDGPAAQVFTPAVMAPQQ